MKKFFFSSLVISTFIVAVGIGLSACSNNNAQQRNNISAPDRWEYKVIEGERSIHDQGIAKTTNALNALGEEGWELVSSVHSDRGYIFLYLKRKL